MPTFPIHRSKRGRQVAIYRTNDGRFRVQWRADGKRRSRTFGQLPEAELEANRVLKYLVSGSTEATLLGPKEAATYRQADAIARRLSIPVDEMCRRYAEAVERLPEGVSLASTIDAFLKIQAPVKTILVDDAIQRYMAPREGSISPAYFKREALRLRKFGQAFQCRLEEVDRETLRAFIENLDCAPKTRNDYRASIRSLFNWAVKNDYLPNNHRLNEALDGERVVGKETEVYSPEELARLLEAAPSTLQPRLALAAWAGLRSAECMRVSRENIQNSHVVVNVSQAKTRSRRTIPMCDALKEYLDSRMEQLASPWEPSENRYYALWRQAHQDAAITMKKNGLRHSFCSYRLALLKDENQVALESGNSPKMIHGHYRALVDEGTAKRWFQPMELETLPSSS